jgi:hypothetical protein
MVLGVVMAKVIEFYLPQRLQNNAKWIPLAERGKVIQFPATGKKVGVIETATLHGKTLSAAAPR